MELFLEASTKLMATRVNLRSFFERGISLDTLINGMIIVFSRPGRFKTIPFQSGALAKMVGPTMLVFQEERF
eukprot:7693427-Pyramimonas_sp.AAC.1